MLSLFFFLRPQLRLNSVQEKLLNALVVWLIRGEELEKRLRGYTVK